ncbi:MAG: hypothetical protein ACR2RE_31310 [Geminicoccaceae bacterium]
MTRYLISYMYRDDYWSAEIEADSFDDATARLRSMGLGTVDGEIKARIPVFPRHGFQIWIPAAIVGIALVMALIVGVVR